MIVYKKDWRIDETTDGLPSGILKNDAVRLIYEDAEEKDFHCASHTDWKTTKAIAFQLQSSPVITPGFTEVKVPVGKPSYTYVQENNYIVVHENLKAPHIIKLGGWYRNSETPFSPEMLCDGLIMYYCKTVDSVASWFNKVSLDSLPDIVDFCKSIYEWKIEKVQTAPPPGIPVPNPVGKTTQPIWSEYATEPPLREDLDPQSRYYDAGGIETIDVIKAKLTPEQLRGYLLGNLIKYSCRMNFKGSATRDAEKCKYYSQWLAELENESV